MVDEFTIMRFEGDGPFVLPRVNSVIKIVGIEGSGDLMLEWSLPDRPGQTQKIVQLPVAPKYAMALMLVLQQAQKQLDLPIPIG